MRATEILNTYSKTDFFNACHACYDALNDTVLELGLDGLKVRNKFYEILSEHPYANSEQIMLAVESARNE